MVFGRLYEYFPRLRTIFETLEVARVDALLDKINSNCNPLNLFNQTHQAFKNTASISFLHYEQLTGTNGKSSIRVVNGMVERILFREFEGGIRIIVLSLDDTHYGNKK